MTALAFAKGITTFRDETISSPL